MGTSPEGNILRMENALGTIPKRLSNTQAHLAAMNQQMDAARAEVGKPFPQEAELKTKSARLAELDAELNMDQRTGQEKCEKEREAQR